MNFPGTRWEDRRVIDDLRMGVDRRLVPGKPSHLRNRVHPVCTKVGARLGVILYLSYTGPYSGGHWWPVESLARMLVKHLAFPL